MISTETSARMPETLMTKDCRVLFVIPGKAEGSSMSFAKIQADYLVKAGIIGQSIFLSSRLSPLWLFKEWCRMRRDIKTFKPDLIHANYGSMTAWICALSGRVPLIITFRGSDLNMNPANPWLVSIGAHILSQLAALRAKWIICVSQRLKDRLWWRQGRASVIPSGIDTSLFYPRSQNHARSDLGWDFGDKVILFNGRWKKGKRLDLAQKAVDVAQSIYGRIRFVVLDGSVAKHQMPLYMNAADCLLLTSDCEGSPNVVKEALACNLPVVSVDVGDVQMRIAHCEQSILVEQGATKIGQALAKVLSRGKRGTGSESIGNISIEACTEQIIAVYTSILDHRLRSRNGQVILAQAVNQTT